MKKLFLRFTLLACLIGLGAAGSLNSPDYATVNLGIAGSVNGTVVFNNATSGSITLSAPTGALGTVTDTLPLGGTLLSSTSSVSYSQLPALSANQVLGALTATTPTGQSVPSCSATSDALIWTAGTGFGCVTGYAPLASPNFTGSASASTLTTNTLQAWNSAYTTNVLAASLGSFYYRINVYNWGAQSGAWIDMPTSGDSALGSGGLGNNAWVAYAASNGSFLTDAVAGDIIYRNISGSLRFGTSSSYSQMQITSSGTSFTTTAGVALGAVTNTGFVLHSYTVSSLPTCNSGTKNTMAAVTDATSPTYNGTLTGGGSVNVPVFCNGTAWVSN